MGWRGDGSGCFPDASPVTSWSTTKNVRWSVFVGSAHSSPIITEKFVFVTSEPNTLIALDRFTGKECWRVQTKPEDLADEKNRKVAAEYVLPKNGSGMAAATPLTDGQRVYAVFANGIIRAVGMDGQSKWTAFIGAEQSTGYGRSSSPIIVGGKLIVHLTHLYAFDPATGKELWRNTEAKSTYGTPARIRVAGSDLIITPAGDVVRVENGKGVASGIAQSQHTTPLVLDDAVYFAERPLKAVRITANFIGEGLWEGEAPGEVFGSPLLHDGLLFVTTGQGELFAFDTHSKEPQNPIIEGRALFGEDEGAIPITYSSITLAGKYLFLNSNKGDMVVLEASRDAKLVSKNSLPGGTGSSPVFSGNELFVRAGEKLYSIGPLHKSAPNRPAPKQ